MTELYMSVLFLIIILIFSFVKLPIKSVSPDMVLDC